MKKILVSVDFSDITNEIINRAVYLARQFDSELWLIHVAPPNPDYLGFKSLNKNDRHQVAEGLCTEHKLLQDQAHDLRKDGINASALLVQGPTAETILEEAAKLDADLIVLACHGHGAIYKALLGSVSEGVLRGANCPLLIVPVRS